MARNRGFYLQYGQRQNGHEDERVENFGFLRGKVEELVCQGVKPWDDDAWVSLTDFLLDAATDRSRRMYWTSFQGYK